LETTDGGKKVFSFKISFSKGVCERLLEESGFVIKSRKSHFPLLYFLLSIGKTAMQKGTERVRAPYMYVKYEKNIFKRARDNILSKIDDVLSKWPLPTAYELWYEVEKPLS
jgi:hypothetical protein